MAVVYVPTLFRTLCGGANRLELPGTTLDEVLRAVDVRCPGFYAKVVADGRVRPELAVAIDGEAANYPLYEPIGPGTEVTIVPAIAGG